MGKKEEKEEKREMQEIEDYLKKVGGIIESSLTPEEREEIRKRVDALTPEDIERIKNAIPPEEIKEIFASGEKKEETAKRMLQKLFIK